MFTQFIFQKKMFEILNWVEGKGNNMPVLFIMSGKILIIILKDSKSK